MHAYYRIVHFKEKKKGDRKRRAKREKPRRRNPFSGSFSAIDLLAIGTYFSSPFSNPKTTSSTW